MADNRSSYGIEHEKTMRRLERDEKRLARRSKTYTAADMKHLYATDPKTECWIWFGEYRDYTQEGGREMPVVKGWGFHKMCGVAHNAMSRPIFEEHLGRVLKSTENVFGTCATNQGRRHACVNPAHHEIRHGAGIFFDREMLG